MTYVEMASVVQPGERPAESAVRARPLPTSASDLLENTRTNTRPKPTTPARSPGELGPAEKHAAPDGSIVPSVVRLARRLDAGDLQALERLYDLLAERLLRYALALLGNRHDAEDALQACMVRIAEKPRRIACAEYPYAYCLRILRNETLRLLSRRRRARSLPPELEAAFVRSPCEEEDWREQIRRSLQHLPAEQREVVVLKIWEGMTFLEIAKVVGESPNTVASRYRYALEKLSRFLQPLVEDRP